MKPRDLTHEDAEKRFALYVSICLAFLVLVLEIFIIVDFKGGVISATTFWNYSSIALAIFSLFGIYPVSYISYFRYRFRIEERMKDELKLLGLLSEKEIESDNVGDLYHFVYSPLQFVVYISMIFLVSTSIVLGYIHRDAIKGYIEVQSMSFMFFGYLGAFVFSIQELIRRYNTFDLQPQVYSSILTRILVSVVLTFVGASIFNEASAGIGEGAPADNASWAPVLAFVIGIFPSRGLRWFVQSANRIFSASEKKNELSILNIDGISHWHEARLSQLGIDDAQNLATIDIRKLLLTTQFDPQEIVHWIDQAILYVQIRDKMDRFRDANINTFHEFRQEMNRFSEYKRTSLSENELAQREGGLSNLVTVLGMQDETALWRLADYSNFPNYNYIAEYYTRIGMVARQHAEIGMGNVVGAIEETDFAKAIEYGKSILAHRPDNPHLQNYLGKAYYYEDKNEEALEAFNRAITLDDQFVSAYFNRSLAHIKNKNYPNAIQDCTKAIQLHRGYAEAFNNRAIAYIRNGDHEMALKDLKEALRLDDRLAAAYFNRGTIYNVQKEYQKALDDFDRAYLAGYGDMIEISKERSLAFLGLACYDMAVAEFTKIIVDSPDLAEPYAKRGYAYLQLKKEEQASKDLEAAIDKDNTPLEAYFNLASLEEGLGKYNQAIKRYEAVLEQEENNSYALYNIGYLYYRQGEYDKAQDALEKFIDLEDDQDQSKIDQAKSFMDSIRLMQEST